MAIPFKPPGNTWTGLGYTLNSLVNQADAVIDSVTHLDLALCEPRRQRRRKLDPNYVYDVARVGLTFVGFVFIRPRRRFG